MHIIETIQASEGVWKFLQRTDDEHIIMTMCFHRGNGEYDIDFSTQIGCPKKCGFCLSKIVNLIRSLTDKEIVEQCLNVVTTLADKVITKLRFRSYGEGEPFTTLTNVVAAILALCSQEWNDVRISFIISTTGTNPGLIEDFGRMEFPVQVDLQFSLHAGDDQVRAGSEIVPLTPPLARIIPALREYFRLTGRPVICNYVACAGLNDSSEQALKVATLLAPGDWGMVRFGTLNQTPDFHHTASSEEAVAQMETILHAAGIATERHRTEACGLLTSKY